MGRGALVTIGYALERVMAEYPDARDTALHWTSYRKLARQGLPEELGAALGDAAVGLKVRGSAGQGVWAAVPWVSVFDRAITETAMSSYYVVYLFHAQKGLVHLSFTLRRAWFHNSLNQGATATRAEFPASVPPPFSLIAPA